MRKARPGIGSWAIFYGGDPVVDRCAICGEPVPEGRQVCPLCQDKYTKGEDDHDQCMVVDPGGVWRGDIRYFPISVNKWKER